MVVSYTATFKGFKKGYKNNFYNFSKRSTFPFTNMSHVAKNYGKVQTLVFKGMQRPWYNCFNKVDIFKVINSIEEFFIKPNWTTNDFKQEKKQLKRLEKY